MFRIWKEHRHFGKQIFLLSKNELIKTYKGAFLGFGWAIIKPLITLFALWFMFQIGLRGDGMRHGHAFFYFLLAGYVPWFYINDNILYGAKCIRQNSQFVTKISYPVSTIMTFTALSKLYIHIFLTAIMYVVLLIAGYTPSVYNLQFFLYCPLMFLFFLGLSWITAPLSVFSRDFENLVNSILTMLFWMSGVLWDSYSVAGTWLNRIMLLNPINFIVNGYRKTFLYGEWFWQRSFETANKTIQTTDALWENVIFLAELVLVLAIGAYNYNRTRKTMPDIL